MKKIWSENVSVSFIIFCKMMIIMIMIHDDDDDHKMKSRFSNVDISMKCEFFVLLLVLQVSFYIQKKEKKLKKNNKKWRYSALENEVDDGSKWINRTNINRKRNEWIENFPNDQLEPYLAYKQQKTKHTIKDQNHFLILYRLRIKLN